MLCQYIICTHAQQGSSCHALIWFNLSTKLEFWVRSKNMYSHFTLKRKLNIKHKRKHVPGTSNFCWMFYVVASVYLWGRRVSLVRPVFHVGWCGNLIGLLAFPTLSLFRFIRFSRSSLAVVARLRSAIPLSYFWRYMCCDHWRGHCWPYRISFVFI
jgi:hypothetical protein